MRLSGSELCSWVGKSFSCHVLFYILILSGHTGHEAVRQRCVTGKCAVLKSNNRSHCLCVTQKDGNTFLYKAGQTINMDCRIFFYCCVLKTYVFVLFFVLVERRFKRTVSVGGRDLPSCQK